MMLTQCEQGVAQDANIFRNIFTIFLVRSYDCDLKKDEQLDSLTNLK